MFNRLKRNPEITTWSEYGRQEEIIDGELVIAINEKSTVEDLNKSIANFMSDNGMNHKYKVIVSKIEDVS